MSTPPTTVADELAAMRKIVNTLEKLDRDAQNRVLTWLDELFDADALGVTTPAETTEPSEMEKP